VLKREFYNGDPASFVMEPVLTTEDTMLTVYYLGDSGYAADENRSTFGMTEIVQVHLADAWYTLPFNLSQRNEPLVLGKMEDSAYSAFLNWSADGRIEHKVDLSPIGGLPPGRYRLVQTFFNERFQLEHHCFSYFWVIEPGDERPPEAGHEGDASIGDLIIRLESPTGARKVVTDKDNMLIVHVENLSGRRYGGQSTVLEILRDGQWENVGLRRESLIGLVSRWSASRYHHYFENPLEPGRYRLRNTLRRFYGVGDYGGAVGHEYEFTVLRYEDAPEPVWDVWRLNVSRYDAAEQSTDATLTIKDPVLNDANPWPEYVLTSANHYTFCCNSFTVDILLDGIWYVVPFVGMGCFFMGNDIDPDVPEADRTFYLDVVAFSGLLPAGQYRIIQELILVDPEARFFHGVSYLAREFAVAEFTVEESLDWLLLRGRAAIRTLW